MLKSVIMNFIETVCVDNVYVLFEYGSYVVKN